MKLGHGDAFPFHLDAAGNMERCNICGRKLGADPRFVEVIDGGDIHDPATGPADTSDAGYMGTYPVGPECAKRLQAGIATKG